MWRWSGHFTPGQHEALAFAAVAFIQDMILNDFEPVEEAVMQAIQRVGVVCDDMRQKLGRLGENHPVCQVFAQVLGRLDSFYATRQQKVLALQNVEPGMLGAIAIKFLVVLVEVADEIVAADREMLAEGRPGKLRGKTFRKAQVLREPAEAALVSGD